MSINKVVDLFNEGIFSGIHYSLNLKPLPFQHLTHCFYIFYDATYVPPWVVLVVTGASHQGVVTLIEFDPILIRYLEAHGANGSLLWRHPVGTIRRLMSR